MPNEQLLAHIRAELTRGVDRATVIQSLITAGWKVEDINVRGRKISDNTTLGNIHSSDNTTLGNKIATLQSDNTTQNNRITGNNQTLSDLISGSFRNS